MYRQQGVDKMGIYVYTLRKNTVRAKDMDTGATIEIGVAKYAYKQSSNRRSDYNRVIGRMHGMAERARWANPNLVLLVHGDPKENDFDRDGKMTVYRVSPELEYYYDTKAPGDVVGYLFKNRGKLEFERI